MATKNELIKELADIKYTHDFYRDNFQIAEAARDDYRHQTIDQANHIEILNRVVDNMTEMMVSQCAVIKDLSENRFE